MKTKSQPYTIPVIFSITILLYACKAIIEPSINNREIVPLAPGDQTKSASYAINFWWEPVEDALTYNLQIVRPDFNNITALVSDTVIRSNKFTLNLKPGQYQWRVRALNGSSQTQFSQVKSFTILLSSIKGQSVQLKTPPNNFITNQPTVGLEWSDLYGATKYFLQIDTNNFANDSVMVYKQAIPGQQFTFTFPKDQIYQWRVRAENDTAKADWSSVHTMSYDHTPPGPVTIVAPANNQQVNTPVSLLWNTVVSATRYKLYIFKSDSVTAYNGSFPTTLTSSSFNFTGATLGERVVWKVSAVDAAGNEGSASAIRSFILR